MPKITDTRTRTRELALAAYSKGEELSGRKIRAMIGGGSLSTITSELKQIEAERTHSLSSSVRSSSEMPDTEGNETRMSWSPESGPRAHASAEVSAEITNLIEMIAKLTSELSSMRIEIAELRTSSEAQLKLAYDRYEAVQRQSLLQIEAARREAAELREKLRNASVDAQIREDALRGKAQQLRDENSRLQGRIDILSRQNMSE